jgi:integrase
MDIGPTVPANSIGFKDIGTFLHRTKYSVKSKHDTLVVFKEMMEWSDKCGYISSVPEYPKWRMNPAQDMKVRKNITKSEQTAVLSEIKNSEEFKVYLACRWLATYIHVRPMELMRIKEGDIDRAKGIITIRRHKTSRLTPKQIVLLQDDIALLGLCCQCDAPDNDFFRSEAGVPYGEKKLLRAWKRACAVVGIQGVDLYGGTRHSSVISLYKESGFTPEEIRIAGGWSSMASYRRYFNMDIDDVRRVHSAASPGVI